jgi:hypothetical protein
MADVVYFNDGMKLPCCPTLLQSLFLSPSGTCVGDCDSNYTGFVSGDLTYNIIYRLPVASGTVGQVLTTDGNNNLSWTTVSGGGGGSTSPAGLDGYIQYNNSGSFGGASILYWNDTNSRLGVGTSSPAQTLHVAGTMRLTGSTGTGTTLMARDANGDVSAITVSTGLALSNNVLTATGDTGGTLTGSGTATQVAFWDGITGSTSTSLSSTSNLYWDNNNNRLGIGTTTPITTLEVNGIIRTNTGFQGISDGAKNFAIERYSTNSFSDEFAFRKARGTTAVPLATVREDEAGAVEFYAYHGSGFTMISQMRGFVDTNVTMGSAGGRLSFYTNSGPTAGYGTERMRLNSFGNLLIGTITTGSTGRLQVVSSNNTNSTWTAQFHNSTGSNNALMIRDDGRIGIGTANPNQTLEVAGTMRLTGSTGTSIYVLGRDNNGDISNINLGNNFVLSGGTLSLSGVTTGYIPYVGAVQNVDLGVYDITSSGVTTPYIQLSESGSTVPLEVGMLTYNGVDGTLEFLMKGGNVVQQIGQELPILVKNFDNAGLLNGKVVYYVSSDGTNKLVRYAVASSETASVNVIGLMTEDATGGNKAYCTTFGLVRDIDTSTLQEGKIVWLSATELGGMTTTRPLAPNHGVQIGFCIKQHAVEGSIFVSVQNGYELDELHNVLISSGITDGDLMVYNSSLKVWENKQPSNLLVETGSTANTTIDFKEGNIVDLTLTSSTSLIFNNSGVGTYIIKVIQGGTGSNLITWPSEVIWSGGVPPTLSITVGKTDIITLIYDGVNYYGSYVLNF